MAKAAPKPKKLPARRAESAAATKKTTTKAAGASKPAPTRQAKAAPATRSAPPARKAAATKTDGAVKKAATKAPASKPAREPAARPAARKAAAKTEAAGTAAKSPARAKAPSDTAAKAPAAKPAPAKPESAKPEPAKKAPPRRTTVICPLSGFEVKPDKPNLSPRTIDRLRTKLLEERARHVSQAEQLQAEAAQLAIDREEGDTQFDEEGGEGDTISVERERDLMLSASARQIVEEIDRALERMRNKTYGLCSPAGRRISVERLEALPYAETCVDCKARAERRR
jgi:RNA polymerase-binding transcription factor DksA